MLELEKASISDASLFSQMEQDPDTQGFIFPSTLSDHVAMLSDPRVIYLRILNDGLAGFFILALDKDA